MLFKFNFFLVWVDFHQYKIIVAILKIEIKSTTKIRWVNTAFGLGNIRLYLCNFKFLHFWFLILPRQQNMYKLRLYIFRFLPLLILVISNSSTFDLSFHMSCMQILLTWWIRDKKWKNMKLQGQNLNYFFYKD